MRRRGRPKPEDVDWTEAHQQASEPDNPDVILRHLRAADPAQYKHGAQEISGHAADLIEELQKKVLKLGSFRAAMISMAIDHDELASFVRVAMQNQDETLGGTSG